MNEAKIKELFSNEEYVKGLFELGSYEKASEKLAEDGVEISPEELKKALELAKKKENGELSDEELKAINGGTVAGGIALGLLIASVLGAGGYFSIKNGVTKKSFC